MILEEFLHLRTDLAQGPPFPEQRFRPGNFGKPIVGAHEDGVIARLKQPPGFLGREAQNRCYQPQYALRDVVKSILRRAARGGIRATGIQPVLEDIQIERAEILGTEGEQPSHGRMKFIAVVVLEHVSLQVRREHDCVAVDFEAILHRDRMPLGIEIGNVREQKPQGVANAAIGLDHPLQDLVGDEKLSRVVGRRHPEAQDLRAQRLGDFSRSDDVAERFRHLAAFAVNDEPMREQRIVRRPAVQHARHE